MQKINTLFFEKESFSFDCADFIYESIEKKLQKTEKVNIALSGGSTPLPILASLAKMPLNWEQLNFYLVDERCVPISSKESNYGSIKEVFFDKILSASYNPIRPELDFEKSASDYQQLIINSLPNSNHGIPAFDLILLGMGEDGHTASLFPYSKGLFENRKIVFVNNIPQLNTNRITFSFPLILNAKEIIVIITGQIKINILKEINKNKESNNFPIATIINKHAHIDLLLSN